jgi:hypothetical protein
LIFLHQTYDYLTQIRFLHLFLFYYLNHHNVETCVPELNEDNNCFVIDGGVTVTVDGEDTDEIVIEKVFNATKEIIEEDLLLTEDNPEVKKVKLWKKKDDFQPAAAAGGIEPGIAVGAVVGLLALIIGGSLVKKKTDANTNNASRSLGTVPIKSKKSGLSFVAPDAKNLGKHATCMDVHECKSAMCPKCYVDRSIMFVDAPNTPRPPPAARVFEEAPTGFGWHMNSDLGSSSFESSSTAEFY